MQSQLQLHFEIIQTFLYAPIQQCGNAQCLPSNIYHIHWVYYIHNIFVVLPDKVLFVFVCLFVYSLRSFLKMDSTAKTMIWIVSMISTVAAVAQSKRLTSQMLAKWALSLSKMEQTFNSNIQCWLKQFIKFQSRDWVMLATRHRNWITCLVSSIKHFEGKTTSGIGFLIYKINAHKNHNKCAKIVNFGIMKRIAKNVKQI